MHREIEVKYDVAMDAGLPDLAGLPGVAEVAAPVQHDLEAVYYDTDDLALARARKTLRRRTGGDDGGWHLKRPVSKGVREEVHAPLGEPDEDVPLALVQAVRSHVRDRPLAPISRLSTRRVVHRLLDDAGVLLAEVADDTVSARTANPGGGETRSAWREWEVELGSGDDELLEAVGKRLLDAGAVPAAGPSKVARALGDRLPPKADGSAKSPSKKSSAGAVVQAHVGEQVAEIITRDPYVREDVEDALHKMRVGTRRLRSALATFRPLYDRSVTDPIRDELKWLATELGYARDAEVMRDRLLALVAEQPPELVLGPVARRIDLEMRDKYRTAHAHVLETLESERYFRLLDALDRLGSDPPLTSFAKKRASDVLPGRVQGAWKRMRHAASWADATDDAEERDPRLHEVRKSAKRARYAGEAMTPVFGKAASNFATAMEHVQEVLGEHQDSVVTRDLLRQLGVQADLKGENALTFGRLHALEETAAAETEVRYREAWAAAAKKALHRWTKRS